MELKSNLISEFKLRVFSENYERIFKCLNMLDDKQLWQSPNANIPSAGNLILHLCGNARQWILSGIGEKIDNRNREQEFLVQKNIRKSDLIFLLENLRVNIISCLSEFDEKQLFKPIRIQGFKTTKFSAIIHVIEHFSYHTGQITTITKFYSNQDTGYYSNFNLNQLN